MSGTEPAVLDQEVTRTEGMDGARGPGPGAERGWMAPGAGPGLGAYRMDGACSSERTAGMDGACSSERTAGMDCACSSERVPVQTHHQYTNQSPY